MTGTETKQELTDRELDVEVAKALGIRILTQDEMLEAARKVWEDEPGCVYFRGGFSYDGGDDARPKFKQKIREYSTSPASASELKHRLREQGFAICVKWFEDHIHAEAYRSNAHELGYRYGSATAKTEERAIALLVLDICK